MLKMPHSVQEVHLRAQSFFEYGNGIFNTRNGETVGIRNNYPRLGIEPFDENEPYDPALNEAAQQGAKTGEAAGVLGWRLVSDVENPVGGATEANILNSGLGYTTGIKTTFAVSGSGSGLTIDVSTPLMVLAQLLPTQSPPKVRGMKSVIL